MSCISDWGNHDTKCTCSQELTLWDSDARRVTVTENCDKWHSGKMKKSWRWGNVGWGGYHRMTVVTSDQGGSGMAGCDQGCRAWTWDEQSRAWRGREAAIARAGRCWLANVWCRPCHELVTWPQCDGGWPGTEQCHTRTARAGPGDTERAERGPGLWHSVRDTPGTGRHRDTSVTVWHSDVTRNTDNITLESFATETDVLEFYKSFFWPQQHNKISRQHGASTSDQFWYSKAAGRRFIWSWVSAFRSPSNLLLELSVGCGERKRLFWIRGTSSSQRSFELGQSSGQLNYYDTSVSKYHLLTVVQNWIWKWNGFYFMLHWKVAEFSNQMGL